MSRRRLTLDTPEQQMQGHILDRLSEMRQRLGGKTLGREDLQTELSNVVDILDDILWMLNKKLPS